MITRKDYMAKRATFTEFYQAVNATAGLVVRDKALLDRVRVALDAGDVHLNTIPLAVWDRHALCAQGALARAFKAHGDFYSLAGGVCAVKTAARDAVT
jgi:hypothetical protein